MNDAAFVQKYQEELSKFPEVNSGRIVGNSGGVAVAETPVNNTTTVNNGKKKGERGPHVLFGDLSQYDDIPVAPTDSSLRGSYVGGEHQWDNISVEERSSLLSSARMQWQQQLIAYCTKYKCITSIADLKLLRGALCGDNVEYPFKQVVVHHLKAHRGFTRQEADSIVECLEQVSLQFVSKHSQDDISRFNKIVY